jgi:5-formyltetrahydrofolate cyclo-ligase
MRAGLPLDPNFETPGTIACWQHCACPSRTESLNCRSWSHLLLRFESNGLKRHMRVAPSPLADKKLLRQQMRAARNAMPTAVRRAAAEQASQHVAALRRFGAGRRVALYLPIYSELDTRELIAAARRRGVDIYVPIVTNRRARTMRFARLRGRMRVGRLGVREPARPRACIDSRWLSLVLVPILAIDAAGYRLGMGAGFYDRAFSFRRLRREWRGPELMAFGFEQQRLPALPHGRWDIALDGVVTDTGVYRFSRESL